MGGCMLLAALFLVRLRHSVSAQTLNLIEVQANLTRQFDTHSITEDHLQDTISPKLLGQRSTLNIIWSCLATIFACTWASVHMNVPPASDTDWKILRRRLKIMVYMLLLPELIIYWASKQWYCARKTAKKHSSRGWTMTHGFFVGMGGFVLQEEGINVRPLDLGDLEDASELKEIDWPETSEDDILDKSKGDYFTKGVVVLQTTWFILQCIARGVTRLAITELEVVTLGFAALSGVMCFFWMKKPLDVRRPVIVFGRGSTLKFSHGSKTKKKKADVYQRTPTTDDYELQNPQTTHAHLSDYNNDLSNNDCHISNAQGRPLDAYLNPPPEALILENGGYDSQTFSQRHHAMTSSRESTRGPTLHRKLRWERGILIREKKLRRRGVVATLFSPMQTLISDMYELKGSGSLIAHQHTKLTSDSCHVSTFYAAARLPIDHKLSLFLFVAGTVFGAIHCIAWASQFPTFIEEWAWKVSALSVTILPSFFATQWIMYSWLAHAPTTHSFGLSISGVAAVIKYVFYITSTVRLGLMFFVYILARIFLLVLPIISLRALPSSAYVDITWTNAVPHI